MSRTGSASTPPVEARSTVLQGGRAKAYRPLPEDDRAVAVRAGLAAYRRGDFFLAHELLEPAWMGTAQTGERELVQGLIKLSAAQVHATRGNSLGVAKNLRGARARLADALDAVASGGGIGPIAELAGVDIGALIASIDDRLAEAPEALAGQPALAVPER